MTQIGAHECCIPAHNRDRIASSTERPKTDVSFCPLPTTPIPGGKAIVGTRSPLIPNDGEGPTRTKVIKPFKMSQTTVTNEAFAQFVTDTNYITDAERIGWSFVFYTEIPEAIRETQGVVGTQWWRKVDGANWRDINGPNMDHAFDPLHPVVQISWNDATAFANWCGGRLPSEAEWEHAARGGLGDVRFPWGDAEPDDINFQPCNIWQGRFPEINTTADGWAATAPAKSFEPNAFELYNMAGNVWEWTADPFRIQSLKKSVRQKMMGMRDFKLLKGGSYLCHRSYCYRYRIAARIGNTPDTATPHQGFRIVWDHDA